MCADLRFCEHLCAQPRDELSRSAHSLSHGTNSMESLALSRADTQTLSASSISAEHSGIIANPSETFKHGGSPGGTQARSAYVYLSVLSSAHALFTILILWHALIRWLPCRMFTRVQCLPGGCQHMILQRFEQSRISHGCTRSRRDSGRGKRKQFYEGF